MVIGRASAILYQSYYFPALRLEFCNGVQRFAMDQLPVSLGAVSSMESHAVRQQSLSQQSLLRGTHSGYRGRSGDTLTGRRVVGFLRRIGRDRAGKQQHIACSLHLIGAVNDETQLWKWTNSMLSPSCVNGSRNLFVPSTRTQALRFRFC